MKRKMVFRLFTVVMVLGIVLSSIPAFAVNAASEQDYRVVYDLTTGAPRVIDINSTTEDITFVNISFSAVENPQNTRSRVLMGTITYNISSSISGNVTAIAQCYQTPTVVSSSGNTVTYSHLWDFKRIDSTAYGATYTMYGNLGSTTYTNAIVVAKNYYSPANWGITSGSYALANNFYVANPEFYGGDVFSSLVSFSYS